jgi:uncharacterized protein
VDFLGSRYDDLLAVIESGTLAPVVLVTCWGGVMISEFPKSIHDRLKHYVYLYSDPRDGKTFYVGKGTGNRVFAHLLDQSESDKAKHINDIRADGRQPIIEILIHGIADDETAKRIEASVIDLLGIDNLANCVRGYESREYGRMSPDQVLATYAAQPVEIVDPVILININRTFRYGMLPVELYDATRSSWVVGDRKGDATYALSVYQGIVQEIYEIKGWFPAGSTLNSRKPTQDAESDQRWEFVGRIADETLRHKYRYSDVSRYMGGQNPIRYVTV